MKKIEKECAKISKKVCFSLLHMFFNGKIKAKIYVIWCIKR